MTDKEKNVEFYTALVKQHGFNYKALNWGSRSSQQKRFEILSSIGHLSGRTILDVGCGLADFYDWLKLNYESVEYFGLDITEAMIEISRERFPDVSFYTCSIDQLPSANKFDYIFASGIFAYLRNDPYDHMFSLIKEMFVRASIGIAFNSLSDWREEMEDEEFHSNPFDVIHFCKSLSKKVVFRHDYHTGDYTIYLYK